MAFKSLCILLSVPTSGDICLDLWVEDLKCRLSDFSSVASLSLSAFLFLLRLVGYNISHIMIRQTSIFYHSHFNHQSITITVIFTHISTNIILFTFFTAFLTSGLEITSDWGLLLLASMCLVREFLATAAFVSFSTLFFWYR